MANVCAAAPAFTEIDVPEVSHRTEKYVGGELCYSNVRSPSDNDATVGFV